jgi:hypothetical protein
MGCREEGRNLQSRDRDPELKSRCGTREGVGTSGGEPRLAEGAGTHLVDQVGYADLLFGRPEAQLLDPA